MEPPHASPSFVGIDVSKDRLDVHIRPSGQSFAVTRDGKGLDQLAADLAALSPALIVLEATGGFESTVAAALGAVGLPLAVVNPRQTRDGRCHCGPCEHQHHAPRRQNGANAKHCGLPDIFRSKG
jgi:transposase